MGINGILKPEPPNPYYDQQKAYEDQLKHIKVPKRHPPLPVDLTKIKPVPRGKL